MRYAVDPLQKLLFDPAESMFSPAAVRYMREDWPGLFRAQMLHLMPVKSLGEHFHPSIGAPTKELYGMAGAIFLKEFFNLTIEETVLRYLTDGCWHYALNIIPTQVSIGHASIERYMKLFAENKLAQEVFGRVTSTLVEALELDVSRQRLDSTHVFSDMANFGRTKLMAVTIKRFLTQLKRHHAAAFAALPQDLRGRYAPAQARLFADFEGGRTRARQVVAQDLLGLVNRFAEDNAVTARSSYQAMSRVLDEQCIVSEDMTVVEVKAKTGGDVMQNPSDPDATYDGHKGPGYQTQIAETCGQDNEAQLITAVQVEPAHESDQNAVEPMLDQLQQQGRKPEVLYADTGYGRNENVLEAKRRGVDLQSPVGGAAPQNQGDLTIDDFAIDERTETVEYCPNGQAPESSVHDPARGQTRTRMPATACAACPFLQQCPVRKMRGQYVLGHTPAQRRSAARRAEQATEAFGENYAIRAGGESTNSGLKRRTGMGRVRTRGRPRVTMAITLRCAGWNFSRALATLKKRGIRDFAALAAAFQRILAVAGPHSRLARRTESPARRFPDQPMVPPVLAAA